MIGKALLLFVDVELFYVIDKFLLEAVLVIIGFGDGFQPFHYAGAYFLHARLLVRLYRGEQCRYVVGLLGELAVKGGSLLAAERDKSIERLADAAAHGAPLLVRKLLLLGLCQDVGHAQQRRKPVLRLGDACLCGYVFYLVVIIFNQGSVDGRGIGAGILFNPYREVYLASEQCL